MEQPTTDSTKTVKLTPCELIMLIIFDIAIILIAKYSNGILTINAILSDLPNLLGNISAFNVFIFGIKISREGAFTNGKSGTKYYPREYGRKKLKDIILRNTSNIDYSDILDKIDILTKTEKYFDIVFKLQKMSVDFIKLWNDYNYYAAIDKKNDKQFEYYKEIEKAVFSMVYEESEKQKSRNRM